jgi:divalent metal cation (Fe/Co/Zn/Cd) transporter
LGVEGVIDTEKCFVRKTGISFHVDLHLIVNGAISVTDGHEIAHRLKDKLLNKLPEISDVLIHIEPNIIK